MAMSEIKEETPLKTVKLRSWVPFLAYNVLFALGIYIFRQYWYVPVLLTVITDAFFLSMKDRVLLEIYPEYIRVFPNADTPEEPVVIRNDELVSYELVESSIPVIQFVCKSEKNSIVRLEVADGSAAYNALFRYYPDKSKRKIDDDNLRNYMAQQSKGGFSTIAKRLKALVTRKPE